MVGYRSTALAAAADLSGVGCGAASGAGPDEGAPGPARGDGRVGDPAASPPARASRTRSPITLRTWPARRPRSGFPNDPGTAHVAQGWQKMQWNFLPGAGVNAPEAWANLFADHRPGGQGVVVAIVDTGIAYRDWRQFRKSPDFTGTRFVDPYDFVANNRYPLDREGHGTFVAGTVAEATNNGFGLTGLAYGASIMPVRVLDENGWGDAATISKGIRYAATHGAQVINLSLEFDPTRDGR